MNRNVGLAVLATLLVAMAVIQCSRQQPPVAERVGGRQGNTTTSTQSGPHERDRTAVLEAARGKAQTLATSYEEWRQLVVRLELEGLGSGEEDEAFLSRFADADEWTIEAFKRAAILAHRIRMDVFGLWELTRRCEFLDIPPRQVVERADQIVARYEKLLRSEHYAPWAPASLADIEHNIEALGTEYCWDALTVIQRSVRFKDELHGQPDLGDTACPISQEARRSACAAMQRWLRENRDALQRERSEGRLQVGSPGRVWNLPRDVVEAFVGKPAPESREGGPR